MARKKTKKKAAKKTRSRRRRRPTMEEIEADMALAPEDRQFTMEMCVEATVAHMIDSGQIDVTPPTDEIMRYYDGEKFSIDESIEDPDVAKTVVNIMRHEGSRKLRLRR